MLWNLYAIGYKNDRLLINKLSESIERNHSQMSMNDLVTAFKAYSFFGYIPGDAYTAMVKMVIKNGKTFDFASLGDIVESLKVIKDKQGNPPNRTLLEIVKMRIVNISSRNQTENCS
jgi:hypothetical protein